MSFVIMKRIEVNFKHHVIFEPSYQGVKFLTKFLLKAAL